MIQPLISVIVPVYNVELYLPRCIESIQKQTYRNIEILLIDDGSTDTSPQICDEYAMTDPRITVLHKENGGLSSARNCGLDISKGEYVSFVDSDDWIEDDMIRALLEISQEQKTQISCAGKYDIYNNIRRIGTRPERVEIIDPENAIARLFTNDGVDWSACYKLFCKSLWESIRFPVGAIYEDMATIYLVFHKAVRIALIPHCYYNYNHHDDSITTTLFSEKNLVLVDHSRSMMLFVAKYYPSCITDAVSCHIAQIAYVLMEYWMLSKPARKKINGILPELCDELRYYIRKFQIGRKLGYKNKIKLFMIDKFVLRWPFFHILKLRSDFIRKMSQI